MLRINQPKNNGAPDNQLEPVLVVDRWHRCEVCGDIIDPGTTALEAPEIGLIHECCEEDAQLATHSTEPTRWAAS